MNDETGNAQVEESAVTASVPDELFNNAVADLLSLVVTTTLVGIFFILWNVLGVVKHIDQTLNEQAYAQPAMVQQLDRVDSLLLRIYTAQIAGPPPHAVATDEIY